MSTPAEPHALPSERASLRVLQVTPRIAPSVGGVETHVREVARRLPALGVETAILTADATGRLPRHDRLDGVPVERAPAYPRNRDWFFTPALAGRIAGGDWDVVHVQSYHTFVAPLAMNAAQRAGIPYVVTFHGGGSSSRIRQAIRAPQMKALRPLLRGADRLVAIADFEVAEYGSRLDLPKSHFTKIPNGADLPQPTAAISPHGTLIVSSGRLENYKGHHRVLAALPHLIDEIPDARLWIVGSGPTECELREQAVSLGVADRVEISSTDRETLAARLSGASLSVLLSEFESHPLAALEAASLGVPLVVAEDNSGLTELARQGIARAVPIDDSPERHAAAMLEQIRTPVRSGAAIPTWDACARRLCDLYHDVVAART